MISRACCEAPCWDVGHVHSAPAPGKKSHLKAQRCHQHAATLPGPRDNDVRLAVPAGASSGISPAFLAPDIFGCPSFELRWVSFSSLLKNHRRGYSILSVPPYSPCHHGWCILSPASLRWLQGTKKSSTTDCWQQKVPESTGTGCSSCRASFPLHQAGVCLLWLSSKGPGRYSRKNCTGLRHLGLLWWGRVGARCCAFPS